MSDPEWVFTSRNATTVRAHIGSMATLPCFVKKGSQFGMVSNFHYTFLQTHATPEFFKLPHIRLGT